MKTICRYLAIAFPLLLIVPLASAQSVVDAAIGFGVAQSPASGLGLDSGSLNYCAIGSSPTCVQTPKLANFFMGFGANFMLWDHFGIGMEAKLQPTKQNYGELNYFGSTLGVDTRTILYDINGIWRPWSTKRASFLLEGGLGGASVRSSITQRDCTGLIGCSNGSSALGSSNHFQFHGGMGVQVNLTDAVFLRPQIDVHWIHNFHQFGRDTVPSYMVWLGYSFGSR